MKKETDNTEMERTETERTETGNREDWLVLTLETPISYQGMMIRKIDLSGVREMTGRDLNMVYDLYMAQGGSGLAMQESTLLFAQILASRASGHPLEAIQELRAKDSVYLKNRVYRFFYLTE